MSDRKPVTTRASGITFGSTVAGYVGAWVLGQLLFALAIAVAEGTGAVDLADDDPIPIPLLFIGTMLSWTAFVLMVWWLSQREGSGSLRRDVGLRFEWRDLIGVPIGAATQLVVLPALYWPLNELWPGTFNEDKLSENAEELVDRANGIGVFLLIVMVVVGAPIVEEIVYRGFAARSGGAPIRSGDRALRCRGILRPDPFPADRVSWSLRRRPRVRWLRAGEWPARAGDRRPSRLQCDRVAGCCRVTP